MRHRRLRARCSPNFSLNYKRTLRMRTRELEWNYEFNKIEPGSRKPQKKRKNKIIIIISKINLSLNKIQTIKVSNSEQSLVESD